MAPLLQSFSNLPVQGTGFENTHPGVIKSGLVAYWDFGNPLSYTFGSSTLYDLSGNGNNATVNGPTQGTYSAINYGGSYLFTGTTSNTFTSGLNLSASNYTIMASTKLTGAQNGRAISGLSNNWLLGDWGGNTYQYYANGWVYGQQSAPYNYSGVDTNWHVWTGTGAGNYSFYEGTTLLGTNTLGTAGPNGLCSYYGPGNTEQSNNYMGFLLAYNRVLTVVEIAQNYNMFRGRYGL